MSAAALSPSAPGSHPGVQLIVRWFEEVWNQGRRESVFDMFPKDAVLHDGTSDVHGPEEFLKFYDGLRAQFSDFKMTPIVSLSEGDLACVHWSAEFREKASGKPVKITGTSIVRSADGHFSEAWQNWDAAGVAAQLV